MLAQPGRWAQAAQAHRVALGPGAGEPHGALDALDPLDRHLVPEAPVFVVLVGQHVGRGGDRHQQQLVALGHGEQVGLGVAGHRHRQGLGRSADDVGHLLQLAALHQGDPVDGRQPGRQVTLGCDPGQQPIGERAHQDAGEEGDGDVAVHALVDEAELDDPQQLQAATAALGRGIVAQRRGQPALGGQHHRLLGGDVGVLAEAGDPPVAQRQQGRARHLRPGVDPDLRGADPHRWPVGVAVERHLAAGGVERQVGADPAGLRPVATERGERHGDQRRVGLAEGVEVDRHGPALEQHVRRHRQLGELVRRLDHHRALAPVVGPVVERPLDPRLLPGPRTDVAGTHALRRLDGDHLGPQLRQLEAGEVAPMVGEVEHPIRRQHPRMLGQCSAGSPGGGPAVGGQVVATGRASGQKKPIRAPNRIIQSSVVMPARSSGPRPS